MKSALKSKKVKLYKYDIRNFKKIHKLFKNIDAVIHLAAMSDIVPSIEDPVDYLETNFNGTLNILEAMRKTILKKLSMQRHHHVTAYPKNSN